MHLTAFTLLCFCLASQALGFYPRRGIGYRRIYNPYSRYNRIRGQVRQAPKQVKPLNLPAKPKQAVATPPPTQPPAPKKPQVEPIHKPAPALPKVQGLNKQVQSVHNPYDPVHVPFDPVYQPYDPSYDHTNLPYDPIYDQTYDYLPVDLGSKGVGNGRVIYVIKEDHPLPRGSPSFNNRPQLMSTSAQNSPIEQQILDIVGQFQQQLPIDNSQTQFQGNTVDQSMGSNFAPMPAQNQAPASQSASMMSKAQPSQVQAQASMPAATVGDSSAEPARADPAPSTAAPATVPSSPAPSAPADAHVDHFDRMMRHQFISEMDLPPHMSAQMMNSGIFHSPSGSSNMDPYYQMQLAEALDFPNHPSTLPGFGPADATGVNGAPAASASTKPLDAAPPASRSDPASTAQSATAADNVAASVTPTDVPAAANSQSSFDAVMDRAFAMGMAEAMDLPGFMLPGSNIGVF